MFDKTDFPGTGQHYLNYPKTIQVMLQNTPISLDEAIQFTSVVAFMQGQEPITVEFSERKTKRGWGVARPSERRIRLFRHSVGTFLHELAHITVGPGHHHNQVFLSELARLYTFWFEMLNRE